MKLGERSHPIHIAPGLLGRAGELIARVAGTRGFIITHPTIFRLHGRALAQGLRGFRTETILVPSGERQKSLRRAAMLWDALLNRGADRESIVIAFGGGVIGDLAGFVAATYMRGVPCVQVPTTLLAQIDASVGGKVAINHPRAKNLIGAFSQPRLVICDVSALSTLRRRDYREGLAEVVKTAAIADAAFFEWLERNRAPLLARDEAALTFTVRRCCKIKTSVVEADERESGPRAILNFGHTVGHALESLAGYGALRHGEAVSVGMVAAARLSCLLGALSESDEARLLRLIEAFGLPTRLPGIPTGSVLAALRLDKKAVGGAPRFVLLQGVGRAEWGREAPISVVHRALRSVGGTP
ncbi:MAG: 3-dehydroquinate synthase [Armatimonadota bacterium]